MIYEAPGWLPGGNLQTLWPAWYARRSFITKPHYRRERWATPDGDFIDVDWLDAAPGKTLLVMFHCLEGSSASHYAQGFAQFARDHQMRFAVPHFRGCSGELNRGPRAYHSGDFEEIDWILARFRQQHDGDMVAVGVSLGGNALMRWAGEMGQQAAHVVKAVASVSAPLHGFKSTDDYWQRASAKPHLPQIRVPALALNAVNDPFIPAISLPNQADAGNWVTLWQPAQGGHVGFPQGRLPGHWRSMPTAVGGWLQAQTVGI